jgi:glycosyltransferase involved in cell wall biosynthesis
MKMTTPKKGSNDKLQVCYLLSYKQPNFTRTASLLAALDKMSGVETTVIRNRSKGVARYWQTLSGLISYRRHHRPDVFIVGFRAQESFWLFYPFMRGRRIIFDEFVNHHDWILDEHSSTEAQKLSTDTDDHVLRVVKSISSFSKFGISGWLVAILDAYMRWVVRRCTYVLEDTEAHAALSRQLYRVPTGKIRAIPVGADQELFKPMSLAPGNKDTLEVFFYGNMLPLHGFDVILDAIKLLNDNNSDKMIHFTLIGGRGKPEMINLIKSFITDNRLRNTTYHTWIDTEKLPAHIAKADVCLGGPFGNTGQAKRVVTGKTYQFLAMGKPTIIGKTDVGYHFKDKVNCMIVPQRDPDALASTINWCAEHKTDLNAIGKHGLELYDQEFSVSSIANLLYKLLDSASGEPSRE